MNTSTLTDNITDTIPQAIVDTLAEVGDLIDAVPAVVADGVETGVTGSRRFARRAADRTTDLVPGNQSADRRWWLLAAVVAALAVVGVVWYSRRSSTGASEHSGGDIADIDARRSVA